MRKEAAEKKPRPLFWRPWAICRVDCEVSDELTVGAGSSFYEIPSARMDRKRKVTSWLFIRAS
jgi:hypothetical protein